MDDRAPEFRIRSHRIVTAKDVAHGSCRTIGVLLLFGKVVCQRQNDRIV